MYEMKELPKLTFTSKFEAEHDYVIFIGRSKASPTKKGISG